MLDYLAKQNKKDEDYLITFDDEYFYADLVWSLKDFLLELSYGLFQDETKLLFNPAAYMDDTKIDYKNLNEEINKRYEKYCLIWDLKEKMVILMIIMIMALAIMVFLNLTYMIILLMMK